LANFYKADGINWMLSQLPNLPAIQGFLK